MISSSRPARLAPSVPHWMWNGRPSRRSRQRRARRRRKGAASIRTAMSGRTPRCDPAPGRARPASPRARPNPISATQAWRAGQTAAGRPSPGPGSARKSGRSAPESGASAAVRASGRSLSVDVAHRSRRRRRDSRPEGQGIVTEMTRIDDTFRTAPGARPEGIRGLCDGRRPDFATSRDIVLGLPGAGVDIIELGMPFTDPMADGPYDPAGRAAGARGRPDAGKDA